VTNHQFFQWQTKIIAPKDNDITGAATLDEPLNFRIIYKFEAAN